MNRQSFYKNVLGGFKEEGIRIMVEEMAIVKSYRLLDVVSLGAGCAVSADVRDWIGGKQRRKNRRVCVLWCVEPNRTNGHGVCVRESPNDLHNKIRFVLGQRMRCLGNVRQNLCQGFTWNMKWGRWGRRKKKIPFCCSQKLHLLEPKTSIFQKILRSRKIGWSLCEF